MVAAVPARVHFLIKLHCPILATTAAAPARTGHSSARPPAKFSPRGSPMHPHIIQRVLEHVIEQDKLRLFTPPHNPNVYDMLPALENCCTLSDVKIVLLRFFGTVIHNAETISYYTTEAQRIIALIDTLLGTVQQEFRQAQQPAEQPFVAQQPRRVDDEMADIYMGSLKAFASELDEPVLQEHIRYLDRNGD